jgi:hypothetical protein
MRQLPTWIEIAARSAGQDGTVPESITIAAFVFGAVLLLVAIVGGPFKIFGAEISGKAGGFGRSFAGLLGVVLVFVGLFGLGSSHKPSDQSGSELWHRVDATPKVNNGRPQQSGCECNQDAMIVPPILEGEVGKEIIVPYDASYICYYQTIALNGGTISWDGSHSDSLPDLQGIGKVHYTKPADYNVTIEYHGSCSDKNKPGCEYPGRGCRTSKTLQIHVAQK